MKFPITLLVAFFTVAYARNISETAGGKVSNAPINLQNGPNPDDKLKCGEVTYSGHDIYIAAQYGVNLKAAGETRGRSKYPKAFDHNDSKGKNLNFDAKDCPEHDNARRSYPLKAGGRYDGGNKNRKSGKERVIYYHKDEETDPEGHPLVYYCGIITHTGAAASGGFLRC